MDCNMNQTFADCEMFVFLILLVDVFYIIKVCIVISGQSRFQEILKSHMCFPWNTY